MTEGFTNFVIDGNGTLLINAEQSPNYVPGVSGWQIRRDGSAEFNDVVARGSVTADEVIFPDATGQATGPAELRQGAPFSPTLVLIGYSTNAAVEPAELTFQDPATSALSAFLEPGTDNTVGALTKIDFGIALGKASTTVNEFEVGNGLPGGYYSEAYEGFTPSLTSGALTTLNPTGGTHIINSDYGASQWSGATWTCPVTADYDISSYLPNIFAGSWANVQRITLNGTTIIAGLGVNNGAVNSPGIDTLTTHKRLNAGDTLQFSALQNSGAARSITAASRIFIARRL